MRRDRVQRAIIAAGFGPLHDDPPGGAPTGDPAPGAPPPDTGNGGGGGAPAGGEPDRSGWIPRDRFDEVNRELQARKKADEERERAEAEKKGEFEKVAAAEREKREAAEKRAIGIARRAAFIAAASGKVADPEAAYKLAAADGLLNDLDVDDEGNAKDAKAAPGIVESLIKKYEFLKPNGTSRSFGEPAGGNGSGPNFDPSKASARELLAAGYATEPRRRS